MNVQFTETVLRDANQSLIATRLPYEKFEPILETMDKAGFYSAECWGGATFDVCLRYLNEDPWERLRKIRAKMPNTKLQMLLRGQNILGYKHYPDDIVRRFVRTSVRNGIDIIRIFDALNDIDNLRVAIEATVEAGGDGVRYYFIHHKPSPYARQLCETCKGDGADGRRLHMHQGYGRYSDAQGRI